MITNPWVPWRPLSSIPFNVGFLIGKLNLRLLHPSFEVQLQCHVSFKTCLATPVLMTSPIQIAQTHIFCILQITLDGSSLFMHKAYSLSFWGQHGFKKNEAAPNQLCYLHKSLNTSGSQISKLLSRESWISKSLRGSLSATVCGTLDYLVSNSKHSVGVW